LSKAKRKRMSQERYIAMWAHAVENIVSPYPKVCESTRRTPEKENAGQSDFLESCKKGTKKTRRQGEAATKSIQSPATKEPCDQKKRASLIVPAIFSKPRPLEREPMTDYEREREARIARNKAVLEHLRVRDTAEALFFRNFETNAASKNSQTTKKKRKISEKKTSEKRSVPPRAPSTRTTRNTARVMDEDPAFARLARENPKEYGFLIGDAGGIKKKSRGDGLLENQNLRTCESWCEFTGKEKGPKMDGHFTGWVEARSCDVLGISKSAEEHWGMHSGNAIERKPKSKESAKDFSFRMMRTNPNAYFYRHNLIGEATKQGEWRADEIELFLETAKVHGCGDKWGLFASHIPGRVGYACSSLYRQHIIPNGLLMDDNFRVNEYGEAVWVGGRRGR